MCAAESRARALHAVVRPRPTPVHLTNAGVDVDLSLFLVVLAGLGDSRAGQGEPRAPAAACDPAASRDFSTPFHYNNDVHPRGS